MRPSGRLRQGTAMDVNAAVTAVPPDGVRVNTQELDVPAVLTQAPDAMAAVYVPPLVG